MPQSSQTEEETGRAQRCCPCPQERADHLHAVGKGSASELGTNPPHRKPFLAYKVAAANRVSWLLLMAPFLLSTPRDCQDTPQPHRG